MKIEINIDNEELQERVTEIVAKKIFSDFGTESRELKRAIEKSVKEVISAERAQIVERAINVAAGKIAYGAAPKLIEKLARGEK